MRLPRRACHGASPARVRRSTKTIWPRLVQRRQRELVTAARSRLARPRKAFGRPPAFRTTARFRRESAASGRRSMHDLANDDAAGPTKANELFARLSETSDGAVKTREKLFAELRAELELHTSLEEEHLFPILGGMLRPRPSSRTPSRITRSCGRSSPNSTACRRTMTASPSGSRSCRRPSGSMPAMRRRSCCLRCRGR